MKRKVVAAALAAVMVVSLLAGCSSSDSSSSSTTAAAETTAEAAAEDSDDDLFGDLDDDDHDLEQAAEDFVDLAEMAEGNKPFEGQTLTISTFSFNAELLQKNIYDPFMEATGCELVVDGANNATRTTKIKEDPSAYDVVIIGDSFIIDLINEGLIEEIDPGELSNLDSIYEIARAPFGEQYGPAYTFNRVGIVYDAEYCPIEITSWADLWNPELENEIAIPDITTTTGPLFYYMTALTFGYEPGVDDDAIFEKLAELKPNVVKSYTSATDTITMLNQGEVSVAILLDYSYTTAKTANPDYVWVDPEEGSYAGFNALNIVKGCDNIPLATAFIDYYLSYDVQYAEAIDGVDSPVRTDIELTEEQAQNFTFGEETVSKLLFPDWDVVSSNLEDWISRWNETFSVQ